MTLNFEAKTTKNKAKANQTAQLVQHTHHTASSPCSEAGATPRRVFLLFPGFFLPPFLSRTRNARALDTPKNIDLSRCDGSK